MDEPTGTPCVWDGIPEDEHGTRYAAGIGYHLHWFDWTRPTKARPRLLEVRRAEADALATATTKAPAAVIKTGIEPHPESTSTISDHGPDWVPWWRRILGSRT